MNVGWRGSVTPAISTDALSDFAIPSTEGV